MKETWNVPDGFWLLQRQVRLLRTLYMTIEGEPEQKGARGHRSAAAFQQQVIDHMVAARRRPFTGPVALDLYFKTTRKNPPAIHRVAKNVLDLLGRPNTGVSPRRRSVLYRDDRQVKYLYVHLDQAWNRDESWAELTAPSDLPDPWAAVAPEFGEVGEPAPPTAPAKRSAGAGSHVSGGRAGRTRLAARPGRDVVADLTMANWLRSTDDAYDESSPFGAPGLPDDFDDDWGVRGRHGSDAELWNYVERSGRFFWMMRFQKAVLAQIDAALFSGLCMYFDGISQSVPPHSPEPYRSQIGDLLRDGRTMSRRQLMAHPLTLKLPGLPRTSREGEVFKLALRERMKDFKARYPVFRFLTVPVKMTFLVVPPEQGKDLDNIALTALPIAHEVLRPHIEPHLLAPQPPGEEPEPWLAGALRRLRSLNANSVAAYQVIELPRTPQDPPEGVLRLALGPVSYSSWWDQAASYVDKRIADADDVTGWDMRRW